MTKEEHFQKELKRLKAEEEDAVRRMGRRPSKFDIPENAPAVLFTEALLRSAALLEASDIHLSPEEDLVRVHFRIDGEREEHIVFPKTGYPAVCARLKVLSSMNVAESRLPQDGRMSFCFYDNDYDVRVSSFPTIFGERFVLRILPRICPYTWEELGFHPEEEAAIQRMLSRPGLVLLTGPTGSGKSTTLACILKALLAKGRTAVTVEDPVEYLIEGAQQLSLPENGRLSFGEALKSVLRQDPDIIMAGEIRDKETAEETIRMALAGKLVLSTLHAPTAAGAVTRLRDLGIGNGVLSDALSGILSQRLIKRPCPHCITTRLLDMREAVSYALPEGSLLTEGAGCDSCRGKGTKGRRAVHEVFEITERIREGIRSGLPAAELHSIALEEGMRPLTENAKELLLRGETDLASYCGVCSIAYPHKEKKLPAREAIHDTNGGIICKK